MAKVIRLTESDLIRIVKRIVSEDYASAQQAAMQTGQQHQQQLKAGVQKVGTAVKTGAQKAGAAVVQGVKTVVKQTIKIGTFVLTLYIAGGIFLFKLGQAAFKLVADLGKKVISFLSALGTSIKGIVVSAAQSVKENVTSFIQSASTNIAEFFKTLWGYIKSLGNAAYVAAIQLGAKIKEIWSYIGSWASGIYNKAVNYAKQKAQQIGTAVSNTAKSIWDKASSMAGSAVGYMQGLFSESEIKIMLENYHYYRRLPLMRMLNEAHINTRRVIR